MVKEKIMAKSFFGYSDSRLDSKGSGNSKVSGDFAGRPDSRLGSKAPAIPSLGQGKKVDLGDGSLASSSMGPAKKGKS